METKDEMLSKLKERLPYLSEAKIKELLKRTGETTPEQISEDIKKASERLR